MHPIIVWHIGDWVGAISAYRLFMFLAATVTLGASFIVAVRRGLPARRTLAALLALAVVVPVGARLLHAATHMPRYVEDPTRLFSVELHNFALFGGLALTALAGGWLCRWLRLPVLRLADSVAPALAAGIALMRIGCFLTGCCFGRVTDLPWGVTFPVGSEAHLYQLLEGGGLFSAAAPKPVHPTQLYEVGAALIGGVAAAWLLRHRAPDGVAFAVLLAWYAIFRIANEFLRAPSLGLSAPIWLYPAGYAATALLATGWLATRRRTPAR